MVAFNFWVAMVFYARAIQELALLYSISKKSGVLYLVLEVGTTLHA